MAQAEMEDGSGKRGIGVAALEDLDKGLGIAASAGCDDWNGDGLSGSARQLAIKAGTGAIAIHGSEQDFAGAAFGGFPCPGDGIAASRLSAAAHVGLEFRVAGDTLAGDALGVNGYDHGLGTIALGNNSDQGGIGESSGIDADFVSTRVEDCRGIRERSNAAADGEGDEELGRGSADGINQSGTVLMRSSDVEQDNFIGASFAVRGGQFGGISGIPQLLELHALDDPASGNVQTRDDSFRQHSVFVLANPAAHYSSQKLRKSFMPILPDFSG